MAFERKTHPRGWTDDDLQYLIGQGLTMVNLYKAMGYGVKGKKVVVPDAFKRRAEKLGYKGKGE